MQALGDNFTQFIFKGIPWFHNQEYGKGIGETLSVDWKVGGDKLGERTGKWGQTSTA